MEPDHAANIENFMKAYPDTTVVANTKTFTMMGNFFRNLNLDGKKLVVANGDSLTLGKHADFRICTNGSLAGGYGYL